MHDDHLHRGYIPDHYGWEVMPPPAVKSLSSDDFRIISALLDGLDESGAEFKGTVQFNGLSFSIGYNDEADEHFIVIP